MEPKELVCGTLTVEDRNDSEYDGVNLLVNGTQVVVLEYDSNKQVLQLRYWATDEDEPTVVEMAVPLKPDATG